MTLRTTTEAPPGPDLDALRRELTERVDGEADPELLAAAGVDVERLDSGCCGLAGNLGFEPGHLEVSEACAERVLLPAVRGADADTTVLADGFSCRTQIRQLGRRNALHLAEMLITRDARGQPAIFHISWCSLSVRGVQGSCGRAQRPDQGVSSVLLL